MDVIEVQHRVGLCVSMSLGEEGENVVKPTTKVNMCLHFLSKETQMTKWQQTNTYGLLGR